MSLENTKWNLNDSSGTPATISFGLNASTNENHGGYGTVTHHYGGDIGDMQIEIIWIEDQKGNFMYQTKGPSTNSNLPTTNGMYHNNSALGWGTNFDAAWGFWRVQMTKIND